MFIFYCFLFSLVLLHVVVTEDKKLKAQWAKNIDNNILLIAENDQL